MYSAESVALKIEDLAKEQNVSVSSLLEKIGLSNNLVSRMKIRNVYPSIDKLQKICEYFNISIDYLIGEDEDYSENVVKKMATAQEIGNTISTLCRKYNVTINKMLNRCELDINLITRMKLKNQMPSIDKLIRIADYFKISLSYMIDRDILIEDKINIYTDVECNVYVNDNMEYICWKLYNRAEDKTEFIIKKSKLGELICMLVNNFTIKYKHDFILCGMQMEILESCMQYRSPQMRIDMNIRNLQNEFNVLYEKFDWLVFLKNYIEEIISDYIANNKLNNAYNYNYVNELSEGLKKSATRALQVMYRSSYINVISEKSNNVHQILGYKHFEFDYSLDIKLLQIQANASFLQVCNAKKTTDIFDYLLLQCVEHNVKFQECKKCHKWFIADKKKKLYCNECGK